MAAAAPKSNKVLVIGGPQSGKKWLFKKILNLEDLLWVESNASSPAGTPIRYVRWSVDTKYYTALIDLHFVGADVTPSDTAAHVALGKDCQGVVLVFDSTQRSEFDAIRGWQKFLKTHNPPILMLIGNEGKQRATTDMKTVDSVNTDAFEWAVDHGLEYIPVHTNNDNSKVKPHPAHFGPPEKYGSDRVIESLQANMWNHLTRKPMDMSFGAKRSSGGGGSGGAALSSLASKKIDHNSKTVVDTGSKVSATTTITTTTTTATAPKQSNASVAASAGAPPAATATSTATATAAKPDATANGTASTKPTASTPAAAGSSSGSAKPKATAGGGGGGGGGAGGSIGPAKSADDQAALEREMASFEALFEQMNAARQRNSMNPNMSDDERRAAAEQAVLSLVQSMGIDDDELDAVRDEIENMNQSLPPQLRPKPAAAADDDDDDFGAFSSGAAGDDDELVVPPTTAAAAAPAKK